MAPLRDVGDVARTYGPTRAVAWITLALMLLTVLYAIRVAVENWSEIGV
jgi:hypothetical protein